MLGQSVSALLLRVLNQSLEAPDGKADPLLPTQELLFLHKTDCFSHSFLLRRTPGFDQSQILLNRIDAALDEHVFKFRESRLKVRSQLIVEPSVRKLARGLD